MVQNYYTDGNTVRELDRPAPQRRPDRQEIERIQRGKSRRNAARRNREKALAMNKGFVLFLTLCVALSAAAAVILIRTQSSVSTHLRNISTIESRITDLKADNDAKYKALMTSVDLNEIKNKAMNELGMTYPREDQVIYYTIENENFMDQYSDIPN